MIQSRFDNGEGQVPEAWSYEKASLGAIGSFEYLIRGFLDIKDFSSV